MSNNTADVERAVEAFNTGALDQAIALCRRQLARNPADPDALLLLGYIHAQTGDAIGAADCLRRASANAPRDAGFLASLGGAFARIYLTDEARAAFEASLALDNSFPWSLQGLGAILVQLGHWDNARHLLERAIANRPGFAPALMTLADLARLEQRFDEARTLAERAIEIAPDLPGPRILLGLMSLAKRNYEQALQRFDQCLALPALGPQQHANALGGRGEALEGLGRYDEAFRSIEQSNAITRASAGAMDFSAAASSPARLERTIAWLADQQPADWPAPIARARPAPVFLVGFPRSGTTLLGQILGAHSEVKTLDENENLVDATTALMLRGDLDWASLASPDIERLRDAYWLRVNRALRRPPAKPVFVDKMPMNLVALPLIRLLFPDAKILLALRDPRDVVISCFKQRFELNAATVQFLTLGETVSYYDVVMRLAETARLRLALNVCELRYESLVSNLQETMAPVLTLLNLAWEDSMADFAGAARKARIRTPSAAAVTRPLSNSSVGLWRNYATSLQPHAARLNHWVQRFGYSIEPY